MRTSGRSGLAGLARALLLALALAACGGSDEGGGEVEAYSAVETQALAAAGDSIAADTCTGPPPAFPRNVLTGNWQALQDSLAAHGVTFPDDTLNVSTARVRLCHECDSVTVQIRSTNLTPCLSPANMKESHPHIVGSFTVMEAFPKQHGWNALAPGTTLLAFARLAAGPATLVYEDTATRKGKASPATAWMFWYCRDSHPRSRVAQARWRPRNGGDLIPRPDEDDEDEEEGGNYGWMACASGCCQFYTPPPNPIGTDELPDQAVGPGINPGSQRPSWCPTPPTPPKP